MASALFQKASDYDDLASARRTLRTEAAALDALAAGLDQSFSRAVDLLSRPDEGRVIVTGMGKSGHVGRKIAATMASTGTPAYYVHPGEASHGDLGMITRHDAVLALSNSGETPELNDIIDYCKRFRLPLVAIVGRSRSTLAEAADAALILPPIAEACPLGLAPTTSTTASMALGDALAVALLERRDFSPTDFQVFHPGGKLGRRLLTVADLMHGGDSLPLASVATPMAEALVEMTSKSFGCVGVIGDDGRLLGVLTDGDLRRHMNPHLLESAVSEIMTKNPKTTRSNVFAAEALHLINSLSITSLFVVDDEGRPVGIAHVHDFLRAGVV